MRSRRLRIRRYKRTGKVTKSTILKLICCLAKADRGAGSPLLRGLAQKLTGVSLEAPKRISDKLILFSSKNKTAHVYIRAALITGNFPPVIVNWLLSNFAMTRINDIFQDEINGEIN